MIISQESKKYYNKHPDKLEAALIKIVNRYFSQAKEDDYTIQAIIAQVAEEVKEELGIANAITVLADFNVSIGANESKGMIFNVSKYNVKNIRVIHNNNAYYVNSSFESLNIGGTELRINWFNVNGSRKYVMHIENIGTTPIDFKIETCR